MESFELHNGVQVPIIGAGTYPYMKELATSVPIMINVGFTLFDTSDNYGNEPYLGEALSQISAGKLQTLTIVTKYSNPYIGVKEAFRESCEKIYKKTSIPNKKPDIYLMHWPYPYLWEKRWREMEQLYMKGLVKAIGVCNFTGHYLKRLLSICQVRPMINQIECHPMFQQRETIEICNKENILVMSYSPLARRNNDLFKNDVLVDIAKKHNKGVGEIILSWNITEGRLPIPASRNISHIQDNFSAIDIKLSQREIQEINSLENGMRIRYDPDKRFSYQEKMHLFIHSTKINLGIKQ